MAAGKPTDAVHDFRALANLEPTNVEVVKMLKICTQNEAAGSQHRDPSAGLGSPHEPVGETEGSMRPDSNDSTALQDVVTHNEHSHGRRDDFASVDRPTRPIDPTRYPAMHNTRLPDSHDSCGKIILSAVCEEGWKLAEGSEKRKETDELTTSYEENARQGEHGVSSSATAVTATSCDNGRPSFMVPGWLESAERDVGEKARITGAVVDVPSKKNEELPLPSKNGCNCTYNTYDITAASDIVNGISNKARLSRLVSDLERRELHATRAETKTKFGKTHAYSPTVAQSEWSSLHEEESRKREEFRQRLRSSSGRASSRSGVANKGRSARRQSTSAKVGVEENELVQESEWASLMEEERKVRNMFRTQLARVNNKAEEKHEKRNSRQRGSESHSGER